MLASDSKRPRRVLFWGVYAGYIVLLVWITFRAALWFVYRKPLTEFSTTIDPYHFHYRELEDRGILTPPEDPETFRVLLLGGSVAEQTGDELQRRLAKVVSRPVRVDNVGKAAHTTRDSINKLEYLVEQNAAFDLILVYHGINDVVLNCIPESKYRDDYTHFGWYRNFNARRLNPTFKLQRLVEDTVGRAMDEQDERTSHEERMDWGDVIKTPPAFEANLRRIVAVAKERDTPIVLMTFATYIPENYTTEKFYAGELGYGEGGHNHSTETWGWADNVRQTVKAHNEATVRVAADHPEYPLIDIESLLTQPSDFCDVCHLTDQGISKFVDAVLPVVVATGVPDEKRTQAR